MRIICPNCDAQYEIEPALMPADGRDVQCSACGHGWFEFPAGSSPHQPDVPRQDAPVEDARPHAPLLQAEDVPRREIDPSALSVLREEAAFEARRREAEALTSQHEFALDEPGAPLLAPQVPPAQAPSPSVARARVDREARAQPPVTGAADPERARAAAPRSGLLPDIDSISSTLTASDGAARRTQAATIGADGTERSGFMRGFALVVALMILALALYIAARPIAAAVPALAPALLGYEAAVGGVLSWLAGLLNVS